MDRRVKERLVGATLLVVLVVLIVPELLSGPKNSQRPPFTGSAETTHSVSVDLTTNQATIGLDEGAPPGGSPTAAPPAAATPAAAVPPAAAAPPALAATPAAAAPPANAKTSGMPEMAGASSQAQHHGWAAQLGSFTSRENAQKLERRLRAQGFAASVSSSGPGEQRRFRVRVGPLADRSAAEKVIAKLRKAGHAASVVAL